MFGKQKRNSRTRGIAETQYYPIQTIPLLLCTMLTQPIYYRLSTLPNLIHNSKSSSAIFSKYERISNRDTGETEKQTKR